MGHGIKAVFFDAGGTLFRPYPSVGHIYAQAAKKYDVHCDPEVLEETFYLMWKKRSGLASLGTETSDEKERQWWHSLVHEVFQSHGGIPRFEECFSGLYQSFEEKELWEIFPEAIDVLVELKQRGLILGIVSNWDLRLGKLLRNLELNTYFDFFMSSSLCGATKPQAKIFNQALKLSEAKPHEALHVGDTYEEDFVGAAALGIHALHLDRNGQKSAAPEKFHIRSLREILNFI